MNASRMPATRASIVASTLVVSVAVSIAVSLALPVAAAIDDDDREEGAARRAQRIPAAYIDECGACHAPYPASALPAASWRGVMTTLDRHFGSDATLAPREAAIVRDWLQRNAGRRAADPAAPLRITRTACFLREHDEVPKSVWRSPSIGTPANCSGCHRGADRGVFSEHDIRLPRASAPRPTDGAKR